MDALLDSLRDRYDPSPRAAAITALGSAFVLTLFLLTPEWSSPAYRFGVSATGFAFVGSLAVPAHERLW
jgi:hypothetical protein